MVLVCTGNVIEISRGSRVSSDHANSSIFICIEIDLGITMYYVVNMENIVIMPV